MTVSYHCDNITQEFEEGQLQVVKNWIEKRDSQIKELESDRTDMKKSFDELKKEYEDMKKKCDELKTEMDKAKGKCDALEAELSTRQDSSEVNSLVRERRQLERTISTRLDSVTDEQLDSLTNRELKETLIKANYDFDDLSDRSDEAINGMFEMAIKYSDSKKFESKKQSLGAVATPRTDSDKENNLDMVSILKEKADQSRALLFGGK